MGYAPNGRTRAQTLVINNAFRQIFSTKPGDIVLLIIIIIIIIIIVRLFLTRRNTTKTLQGRAISGSSF